MVCPKSTRKDKCVQSVKAKKVPKVIAFTRQFQSISPVIRSREPEILGGWANGLLTRGLGSKYQIRREQAEFLIWRFAAPLVRQALLDSEAAGQVIVTTQFGRGTE